MLIRRYSVFVIVSCNERMQFDIEDRELNMSKNSVEESLSHLEEFQWKGRDTDSKRSQGPILEDENSSTAGRDNQTSSLRVLCRRGTCMANPRCREK